MNRIYYYETPMWAAIILCAISISISLLCFIGFYYYPIWAPEAPAMIKWLLLTIGFGFLAAAIRPRNWRPWTYFFADAHGFHFPSECPETKGTEWLTVPWVRVGIIKKEVFYDRFKGPCIALQLSNEEIERFFRDIRLKKTFFGKLADEDGYFRVGYSNAFKDPDHAVRILNEFKAHARHAPAG